MLLTTLLQRTVALAPDKTATVFEGRTFTWSQLIDRAFRLGFSFKKQHLNAGDRLAILAHNSDRYLETQIACLWSGVLMVPLNTFWTEQELLFALQDTSAKALVADKHFIHSAVKLAHLLAEPLDVFFMGEESDIDEIITTEKLIDFSEDLPNPHDNISRDDPVGIFYTGGTTGFPKGVVLSHNALLHSGLYSSVDMQFSSDEVALRAAPMFHMADGSQAIAYALFGIKQCFIPFFEPEATLRAVEKMEVTSLTLLPSMIKRLIEHPRFKEFDVSSVNRLIYGDAPISDKLKEQIQEALPDVKMYQAYGLTEMGPLVTILGPEDHEVDVRLSQRKHSVGRPMIGVSVKIVDDNLVEVAPGEIGQILTTGQNAMSKYWNDPELTRRTLIDSWVVTGDLGFLDEDGYLYIADRMADVINIKGHIVYSVKVENVLLSHPDIVSASVIGIAGQSQNAALHAVLVLKTNSRNSSEDFTQHCRAHLASFEIPQHFHIRNEPMPMSPQGKVLKIALREQYQQVS